MAAPHSPVSAAAAVCLALLQGLIALYRLLVSPLLGPRCRFYPSCSAYASQALAEHGLWQGARLSLARLRRCHPGHPGGCDPVPPATPSASNLD